MKKRLMWLLAATLLLGGAAACQSQTPEATLPPTATKIVAVATRTPVPTNTPAPTNTSAPSPTIEATPTAGDKETVPTRKPQDKSAPTPAQPWQIPPVREGEWAKGNPDAGLVLVEYSDIQ